jgi:hypothetical protein
MDQQENNPEIINAPEAPMAAGPSGEKLQKQHGKIHKLLFSKKVEVPIVILVAAAIGVVFYVIGTRHNNANSVQGTQKNTASQGLKSNTANLAPAQTVNGNTYFDVAKKLSDLKLFKNTDVFGQTCTGPNATQCTDSIALADISYYQIGTTKDSRKIIVFVMPGGIDTIESFALGNSDGTYDILGQMDATFSDPQAPAIKSLSSNVKVNQSIILNDVTFPTSTTLNSQKIKTDYKDPSMKNSNFMEKGLVSMRGVYYGESKYGAPTKLTSKDNVDYYELTANDDPAFQVKEIYGVFKQLFSAPYVPDDEIASSDDGKLAVTWTNGEKNSSIYFSGGQGCGSRGYVIAKNVSKSKLASVGKTPGGQTIYQLPLNDPLVQELYTKDYDKGSSLDDANLKNFTLQQFNDKHSYFLALNGLGEYVVFQRDDLFIRGGCAKPVIYLYPQSDTKVSVSVGAQVTKSAPSYGSAGWQNVMAHPDGSLNYKGLNYPYLFWEGYGNGAYPDINYGTIVKASDTSTAIKNQLARQGLNQEEIKDFMDFWGPKLNTGKPYVRISWLNTGQLNQLAPLDINPKPTTTMRVFLDFEGLDKPYSLQPQKLSSVKRTGFTVVEWGGLMRTGL